MKSQLTQLISISFTVVDRLTLHHFDSSPSLHSYSKEEEGANVAELPGYFFYRVSNYDSLSVLALYNK